MGYIDVGQLACLGVFLISVAVRTVSIRVRSRRNPIRVGARGAEGQVRAGALLVVMNLWVAETLRHVLWPEVRPLPSAAYAVLVRSEVVRVTGLALMAVGLAIFGLALHRLGESWSLGIDTRRPGRLVTEGIYGLSRHPMYLFFNMYLFGGLMVNGTLVFLGFALLMAGLLHGQVLQEERFLERVYGDAYHLYRIRTGRYVTWRPVGVVRRFAKQLEREAP